TVQLFLIIIPGEFCEGLLFVRIKFEAHQGIVDNDINLTEIFRPLGYEPFCFLPVCNISLDCNSILPANLMNKLFSSFFTFVVIDDHPESFFGQSLCDNCSQTPAAARYQYCPTHHNNSYVSDFDDTRIKSAREYKKRSLPQGKLRINN